MAGDDNNVSLGTDHLLQRFLYLGTESNLWKPNDTNYSLESISTIGKLIDEGRISQELIKRFHKEGWFVDPDSICFALVVTAHSSNMVVKHYAFATAEEVCQSSSSLLSFVHHMEKVSAPKTGWGRALRRFVSHWYLKRDAKALAAEITRVKSGYRWNHKDILCLAHTKAIKPDTAAVLKFVVKGLETAEKEYADVTEAQEVLTYLRAVHELKHTTDEHTAARLIEIHSFELEHIPTKLLKSREIWTALIPRLKLCALLRHLPYLHKIGVLKVNSLHLKALLERLRDENALEDGSVGPFETFLPIRQWEAANRVLPGRPLIRQNIPQLDEALLNLHMASFNVVPTTGKRFLVAANVNSTMVSSHTAGCSCISPADVTAILLLALARSETSNCLSTMAYSVKELAAFEINDKMSLSDIAQCMRNVPMGPVDPAAPIQWALEKKEAYDVILVVTDNHTSDGEVHPASALKEYREALNLPHARFIMLALGSRDLSVAPSEETGTLYVAGFHMKLLQVIQDFALRVF